MMSFRILGLSPETFTDLFGLSDPELAARGALRRVADATPGYPCRVGLVDAEPGEVLLLLHFEHQDAATPFRASHAIYVRQLARERYDAIDSIPAALRLRTLSLRAFDAAGMMLDADLAQDPQLETVIERLLSDPRVDYLHAHFAKPGCFAARIERA